MSDDFVNAKAVRFVEGRIREICEAFVFYPNRWYFVSGDENGIRFAEVQDADVWVTPTDV